MDLFAAAAFIVGGFLFLGHAYYGVKFKEFSWTVFCGSTLLIILAACALLA